MTSGKCLRILRHVWLLWMQFMRQSTESLVKFTHFLCAGEPLFRAWVACGAQENVVSLGDELWKMFILSVSGPTAGLLFVSVSGAECHTFFHVKVDLTQPFFAVMDG